MSANVTLIVVSSGLIGVGVYLLLARSVVRALLGWTLMGNGVNLLYLVASGKAGNAPITGDSPEASMSDPVPQALVLTAIVITLAMTAFVLALAHRSWQVDRSDLLTDDPESARIHVLAEDNTPSQDTHEEGDAIAAELKASKDDGKDDA